MGHTQEAIRFHLRGLWGLGCWLRPPVGGIADHRWGIGLYLYTQLLLFFGMERSPLAIVALGGPIPSPLVCTRQISSTEVGHPSL